MKHIPSFLPIIILILHLFPGSSHAMDTHPDWGNLPSEVLGLIGSKLVERIGTPQLKNRKDIPVIIKNLQNLSLVNKNFYAGVNNSKSIQQMISSFAQRFKMSHDEAAAEINLPGAQELLRQYVKESGDYDLYKIVEKIYAIAQEVKDEASKCNALSLECRIDHDSRGTQTKRGLYLVCNSHPHTLLTPWGEIGLYGSSCGTIYGNLLVSQLFFKHLDLAFERITKARNDDELDPCEIIKLLDPQIFMNDRKTWPAWEDICKKISEEDLASYKGKNAFIFVDTASNIYKIAALENIKLPEAELLPHGEYRSPQLLNAIWKTMTQLYQEEMGQVVERPEKSRRVTHPSKKLPLLHTIDDTPQLCIKLIKQLYNEPPNKETCKFLAVDNYTMCRLVETITKIAYGTNGINPRAIFTFRNHQAHNEIIEHGIGIFWDQTQEKEDFDTLNNSFEAIINKIRNGWIKASLVDYPNILYKESEEEWCLFIKPTSMLLETNLIALLASLSELRDGVNCGTKWIKKPSGTENRDPLYMWVKKDAFEQFNKVFNISY